jgi:hypothetical protein
VTVATPIRKAAATALTVSLGLALVGCTAGQSTASTPRVSTVTEQPASSFVGETLQYAFAHSPGSVTALDASASLGLRPVSPDPSASDTVVIAACYFNDRQVNVLILPSTSLTESIRNAAHHGEYDHLLTDCQK